MPLAQDKELRKTGTRFKIYPQPRFLEAYRDPELVWVSTPAGSVQPGPSDHRMYLVDAIEKEPYGDTVEPPYQGPSKTAVGPDPAGHFDYLDESTPEFESAHMYGAIHRVLDIWEGYFGQPIQWHFREFYDKLELIPHVDWNNAQAGFGFLETGYGKTKSGEKHPYCLNFDVLAHETGHIIIFSTVGIPTNSTLTAEYKAYHEGSSDVVALISVLHFDSFVDHLLSCCRGNLCAENELNRIAELSSSEQIRIASHSKRMRDVASPATRWDRLSQRELHEMGEPMTGAMFDILVEVFQEMLVERGLITPELANMAFQVPDNPAAAAELQAKFDAAYKNNEAEFKETLLSARDFVGERLARTWNAISPDFLHFSDVAAKFLSIDRELTDDRYQGVIRDCFMWREIGYGFG